MVSTHRAHRRATLESASRLLSGCPSHGSPAARAERCDMHRLLLSCHQSSCACLLQGCHVIHTLPPAHLGSPVCNCVSYMSKHCIKSLSDGNLARIYRPRPGAPGRLGPRAVFTASRRDSHFLSLAASERSGAHPTPIPPPPVRPVPAPPPPPSCATFV